jgi:hypothetical protein
MIFRHLSKGSVGAGMFALGYFMPQAFGGLWDEERRKGGLGPMDINFMGRRVPWWFVHLPPFIVAQAGATFRRYSEGPTKVENVFGKEVIKDARPLGKAGAAVRTLSAFEGEFPFVRLGKDLNALYEYAVGKADYKQEKQVGQWVQGNVVPQGVKQFAETTDSLKESQYRAAHTPTEYIKQGIPGLRQQLPIKTGKSEPVVPMFSRLPTNMDKLHAAMIRQQLGQ